MLLVLRSVLSLEYPFRLDPLIYLRGLSYVSPFFIILPHFPGALCSVTLQTVLFQSIVWTRYCLRSLFARRTDPVRYLRISADPVIRSSYSVVCHHKLFLFSPLLSVISQRKHASNVFPDLTFHIRRKVRGVETALCYVTMPAFYEVTRNGKHIDRYLPLT